MLRSAQAHTAVEARDSVRVCSLCLRMMMDLSSGCLSESFQPHVFETPDNIDVNVECVSVTLSVTE